ncbi:hypothetical protein I6F26_34415 [Ensifer sp. IC3342]|nr:hypothetical protein [Ensifer sp. BRP08]MCA1451485.1 hypothetical protein [Ensifer sp. IC3342]
MNDVSKCICGARVDGLSGGGSKILPKTAVFAVSRLALPKFYHITAKHKLILGKVYFSPNVTFTTKNKKIDNRLAS